MLFLGHFEPPYQLSKNRMKNTDIENFHYWLVLVGRAGWSKNGHSHLSSESLERLTIDHCTKFEPNRTKIGHVSHREIFFPKKDIWLFGPVWAQGRISVYSVVRPSVRQSFPSRAPTPRSQPPGPQPLSKAPAHPLSQAPSLMFS